MTLITLCIILELVSKECRPATTKATGIYTKICGGNIIFSDEFDGVWVDTNNWIPQRYIPSYTDDDVSIPFAKSKSLKLPGIG